MTYFRHHVDMGWCGLGGGCAIYEVVGGIMVSLLRSCINKLVEINEWFGDREE